MQPDWSLLPDELLRMVSEKVSSITGYIRFRAVCKPWRSSSSPRPRHLRTQLPWLMLPYNPNPPDGTDDPAFSFYDLSESKVCTITLPTIRGKRICGSSQGWLVVEKDDEVSLLNPITGGTIALPPLSTVPNTLGFSPVGVDDPELFIWNPNEHVCKRFGSYYIKKAILLSNPVLNSDCMVIALFQGNWETAFCTIGDNCWTVIDLKGEVPLQLHAIDITYHNGLLYSMSVCGNVQIYDLHYPRREFTDSSFGNGQLSLVEGGSDGPLLVFRDYSGRANRNQVSKYVVYKWFNGEIQKWVETKDIGENILFMDSNHRCICISGANLQLEGLRANSLCYDSPRFMQRLENGKWYCCSIKSTRLEDKSVTEVASNLGSFQLKWEQALWITPSF